MQELIEQFEKRLEETKINQMTTFDCMNPNKYKGYVQAYEEVIEELKKNLTNHK